MTHWPVELRLKQAEKLLEVTFDDGSRFRFPAEFLRVLTDLGYFDRTPPEIAESMRAAFLESCDRLAGRPSPAVQFHTAPMREPACRNRQKRPP